MQFSSIYRKRAVELYESHTANVVFQQLLKEFPEIHHPNEKTLIRWREDMKPKDQSENKLKGLNETKKEHATRLIRIARDLISDYLDSVKYIGGDNILLPIKTGGKLRE